MDHLSSDENEEKLVASLWGAERCLRVLESVSIAVVEDNSLRNSEAGMGDVMSTDLFNIDSSSSGMIYVNWLPPPFFFWP